MRFSPAPRHLPSNEPPTEADRAQAAAVADMLARLIADCDARLAVLDAEATDAANDGALREARAIHGKSLEVRRELDELQAMEHRLIRRFFNNTRSPLTAVPPA